MKALRQLFAYPALPDEEDNLRARTLHRVAVGSLLITTLLLVVVSVIDPERWPRRLVSITATTAFIVTLIIINRRGHTGVASMMLMGGLVAVTSVNAMFSGGFVTPIGYFMVFFVSLGGLLFRSRGVLLWTVLLGLLGLAIVAAGHYGITAGSGSYLTPFTTWLFVMMCMAMAALVHREVAGTLQSSLRRARAEIAVRRQTQDRLRMAIEAGNLNVWILDLRTRCFQADPSLQDPQPFSRAHSQPVPFGTWMERMHPEDRPAALTALQDVIDGKPTLRVELRLYRADGSMRVIEVTGAVEHDARGAPGCVVGMNRDITERRQAEMEREKLVHDLGERVKELQLLHSTARLLQQRPASDRELFEQLVKMIPASMQYPHCCVARLSFRDTLVASPDWRETPWMLTAQFQSTDGDGRIDIAYLQPCPENDAGEPFMAEERALVSSMAELLHNYADLRKYQQDLEGLVDTRTRQMREARDEAERASRAKGDFLATMSHEIRTPMNAILGYAQLLRRDPALAQRHHERLDAILSSGDHLLTLINNVLDMSRIEAGRTTLVPAPFDLRAALGELRAMFAALLAARNLELTFEGVGSLPRFVTGDAGRMRQVLINLLSNALKFTQRGGIHVQAACTSWGAQHLVSIAIADTGSGMSPEVQSRVFGAFEQSALGASAGGAGLGLAISRELARLMGGDVVVNSEEGVGSTFTFSFLAGVADQPLPASARRVAGIRLPQPAPRVLVVDDQPDNLAITDEMLRGVGFTTQLAASGGELLQAVPEWQPDLILMDVRMPGINGIEAISRLRAGGFGGPIVAFTASGLDRMATEARAAGADAVLYKPCKESELLELLQRLLGVDYVYEEPAPAPMPDPAAQTGVVPALPGLLGGVPREVLDQLLLAAVQARTAQVAQIAERVAPHSPVAAARIRKLAGEFRLDELIIDLRIAATGDAG
ncbi:MAG TPA: response regulator [Steroidobacteraceae bacterium]|nr:response regulator [Steroidobacteraceae bacterium]